MFSTNSRISRKLSSVYSNMNAKSMLGTLKNTFVIKSDGTLWVSGASDSSGGILGLGSTENAITKKTFFKVGTDTNWKSLAQTGTGTTGCALAIKTNGELWGWGSNSQWQLNQSSSTLSAAQTPIKLNSDTDWSSVYLASDGTYALKTNKTLWLCGYNRQTSAYTTMVQIYANVEKVSAGTGFILVINSSGNMYHWGLNTYNNRGDGTNTYIAGFNPGAPGLWKEISCFGTLCSGIKTDGTLWIWGINSTIPLNGDASNSTMTSPVNIGTSNGPWDKVYAGDGYLVVTNTVGETYFIGEAMVTSYSVNTPNKLSMSNVKSIVTDGSMSVAVSNDSNAYGWGNNAAGACGAGNLKTIYVPYKFTSSNDIKQIKTYASTYLLMKNDGSLWTNKTSQVKFLNQVVVNPTTLTEITGLGKNWDKFELGYSNLLLQHVDGTLWFTGPLPISSAGATLVKLSNDVYRDFSMTTHILAIRSDGSLWGWGANSSGQLGLGAVGDQTVPTRIGTDNDWVKVKAGWQWSAAMKSDGTIWVWGSNSFGQLGDGTTTASNVPKKFNNDTDWADFTINNHILAVKYNGELWGCGYNIYSQLGNGLTTNILTPIKIGIDNDWSYDKPMSAGTYSSMVSKNNGDVYSWGNDNNTGSSGVMDLKLFSYAALTRILDFPVSVTNMNSGKYHLLFVNSSGAVFGYGDNANYQLADNTTNHFRSIKSLVST